MKLTLLNSSYHSYDVSRKLHLENLFLFTGSVGLLFLEKKIFLKVSKFALNREYHTTQPYGTRILTLICRILQRLLNFSYCVHVSKACTVCC